MIDWAETVREAAPSSETPVVEPPPLSLSPPPPPRTDEHAFDGWRLALVLIGAGVSVAFSIAVFCGAMDPEARTQNE